MHVSLLGLNKTLISKLNFKHYLFKVFEIIQELPFFHIFFFTLVEKK